MKFDWRGEVVCEELEFGGDLGGGMDGIALPGT